MAELPVTDHQQVLQFEEEFRSLLTAKDAKSAEAEMRFVWVLVHADNSKDNARGVDMAKACLWERPDDERELLYLLAVGQYNLGRIVGARKTLRRLLEVDKDTAQAVKLLSIVEDELVNNGLIGLGVAAGAVAVAGGILAALMSSSKK